MIDDHDSHDDETCGVNDEGHMRLTAYVVFAATAVMAVLSLLGLVWLLAKLAGL